LSDTPYKDISDAWSAEKENQELQNLEDLRFSKMREYLSKVRYALTETPAENQLQADMYTQEALNLEFMLKDLLNLRREKIIRAAMDQRRPLGTMVLSEEELYNRLLRGFEGHSDFVKETLTGMPSSTLKQPTDDAGEAIPQEDVVDYVIVRFLRSIDDAIIGIDERTYGPFKKEDLTTIPLLNAEAWSEDGTVMRVSLHGGGTS
jgi:DNA replication initiation complex subunit (GINS family)